MENNTTVHSPSSTNIILPKEIWDKIVNDCDYITVQKSIRPLDKTTYNFIGNLFHGLSPSLWEKVFEYLDYGVILLRLVRTCKTFNLIIRNTKSRQIQRTLFRAKIPLEDIEGDFTKQAISEGVKLHPGFYHLSTPGYMGKKVKTHPPRKSPWKEGYRPEIIGFGNDNVTDPPVGCLVLVSPLFNLSTVIDKTNHLGQNQKRKRNGIDSNDGYATENRQLTMNDTVKEVAQGQLENITELTGVTILDVMLGWAELVEQATAQINGPNFERRIYPCFGSIKLDEPAGETYSKTTLEVSAPGAIDWTDAPKFIKNDLSSHRYMFLHCIELLTRRLRRNILDLGAEPILNLKITEEIKSKKLPSDLRYAALYWINHFVAAKYEIITEDYEVVSDFFHHHLLHWIEVMSLLVGNSQMDHQIRFLIQAIAEDGGSHLLQEINEIEKFILIRRRLITRCSLQIYSSIIFTPADNLISRLYSHIGLPASVRRIQLACDEDFTLPDNFRDSVSVVRFSPDGKQLASGSSFGEIRLWDSDLGVVIKKFRMRSENLRANMRIVWLEFSLDGKLLVSGANCNDITVWEVGSGAAISDITTDTVDSFGIVLKDAEGFDLDIRSVVFSPDGKYLAAKYGSTVAIWDIESEGLVLNIDSGNEASSVQFLPDGKQFISGSAHSTVTIWDIETGLPVRNFEGHNRRILDATISPNGEMIASSSDNGFIIVHDISSANIVQHFPVYSQDVRFSRDCKSLEIENGILSLSLIGEKSKDNEAGPLSITVEGSWIYCNERRCLWIPSEYETHKAAIAVSGNLLAFGLGHNRVTFMEIKDPFYNEVDEAGIPRSDT
ncbi:hypothetical protein TWF694_002707 [Orbilia ellipsospora]|uniref:Uncharacterized protein n=1 Tax=Orbilia ellipsospora TaxID=2528407 RepID=A0AAV9X408_9PEZI